MAHRLPFLALLLFASAALSTAPLAQEAETRRVILTDGTVLVGVIEDEDADPLVIVTTDGIEQRVTQDRIAEITDLIAGRFFRLDPNRSRLLVTPTARSLGAGNSRVSTFLYLFPNVSHGVTDRVDLSGGAFFVVGSGDGFVLANLNAKAEIVRTERASVALGGNAFIPLGSGAGGSIGGTVYALGTVGNEITAGTVGVYGVYGADFETGDAVLADGALLTFGGETQVNNGVKLLGEVLLPIGEGSAGVAFLPGVRVFGDQFAVDLYGVLGTSEGEFGGFAPIINFSYNF